MLDRLLISEANKSPVVKGSLDAIRHTFKRVNQPEFDLAAIPIIFSPPGRIAQESTDNFNRSNFLGSRFKDHNLPSDFLFKPHTLAAIIGNINKRILISSSDFAPLLRNPTTIESREVVSTFSLMLFGSIYPMLLDIQSREVRITGLSHLKPNLLSQTLDFLKAKSASLPNPEYARVFSEIKNYLANNDSLYIAARGTRLELKTGDQIIMPFLEAYNASVKNNLTSFAMDWYVDYMSKKHRWFYLPQSLPRPNANPDIENETQAFLQELGILDNPEQIFDYFKTSRLGVEMANNLELQFEQEKVVLEESLEQLKIHGIGQSDEEQPLVAYPAASYPEVESEEQDQQIPDEEDSSHDDSSVVRDYKKGKKRIRLE